MKGALSPLHAVAFAMCTGFAAIAATAPVAQRAQNASDKAVALAGLCTSVGTVVGALWAGRQVANVRLVQVGLGLLAMAAAVLVVVGTEQLHPLWRALDGASLGVGIVACETLLLRSTVPSHRSRSLALYTLATAGGWALGPLLSALTSSLVPGAGFWVAGGAAVVAMAVAMQHAPGPHTENEQPADVDTVAAPLSTLLRRNITACMTTLHFGAFQAALLIVLPLHVLHQGNDGRVAMVAMASFAFGMVVFTLPNTARGERRGPAVAMQAVCVGGGGAVIAAGLVPLHALAATTIAFAIGATLATLSPLSLLLLVRHNDAAALGAANALYNAHYAVGLALGPIVVVGLITTVSTATLLVTMGVLWLAHAGFIALTAPPVSILVSSPGARS